ncbi:SAM-dependent methyltransferase [Nonomuraea sp. NPDC046570]|uniref:SAM-dependent methyltransferase n=1 Tax=Nonomuraea sp. NPDC046570 TaxID=3155255 RepID=UPI0033D31891
MPIEERVPPGVDAKRPSIARVYDFFLGGKDNFAVDRQVAEAAVRMDPEGADAARVNRTFLRRVVRHLAGEAGVDQFVDIGSGLPTQGNVHEVAGEVSPGAKVIYVDNDEMALVHGRALLSAPRTRIVEGDLRSPEEILRHPDVRALIDFERPVAVLLFAILHHLHDEEGPGGIVRRLVAELPPGSYVAISHFADPGQAHPRVSAHVTAFEKMFNERLGTGRWRTHEEILAFFDGLELLDPGLVPMPEWRPGPGGVERCSTITHYAFLGGVARKPAPGA